MSLPHNRTLRAWFCLLPSLLALFWLLFSAPAQAASSEFELCNRHSKPVYAAIAGPYSETLGSTSAQYGSTVDWVVQAWLTIAPGACATAYKRTPVSRYFYVFGISEDTYWAGSTSNPKLCVSLKAFTSYATETCSSSDLLPLRFIEFDAGSSVTAKATAYFNPVVTPGSVVMSKADNSGIEVTITPGSDESGLSQKVWIAATAGGRYFFRDSASNYASWIPWNGGTLPVTTTLSNLSSATSLKVVDFDVSDLYGMDIYVGYGASEAELLGKTGHLAKVYTVPNRNLSGISVDCSINGWSGILPDRSTNGSGQCSATASYSNGSRKALGGTSVSWSSGNPQVVSVSSGGAITAVSSITDYADTTITASYSENGISKSASFPLSVQHNPIPNCSGRCACPAPSVLNGNACQLPAPTCTASQILVNNVCVTRPSCSATQVLVNGSCVTPTPTCVAPLILQNGQCVSPIPTCTAPQTLVNGQCENDARNYPTVKKYPGCSQSGNIVRNVPNGPCAEIETEVDGYEAGCLVPYNGNVSGRIVAMHQCFIDNSSGTIKQRYQAQLDAYRATNASCSPNFSVNGQCIEYPSCGMGSIGGLVCRCSKGKVLSNGLCVATPTCSAPLELKISTDATGLKTASCVTPAPTCTNGQVVQNGVCVSSSGSGTGGTGGTGSSGGSSGSTGGSTGGSDTGSQDKDGCYTSPQWALQVVKTRNSGGEFTVVWQNTSNVGIYAGFCNERSDGSWDCGADHLGPGAKTSWWTGGGTGRYKADWVGSSKWESDWVCNDVKHSGVTRRYYIGP